MRQVSAQRNVTVMSMVMEAFDQATTAQCDLSDAPGIMAALLVAIAKDIRLSDGQTFFDQVQAGYNMRWWSTEDAGAAGVIARVDWATILDVLARDPVPDAVTPREWAAELCFSAKAVPGEALGGNHNMPREGTPVRAVPGVVCFRFQPSITATEAASIVRQMAAVSLWGSEAAANVTYLIIRTADLHSVLTMYKSTIEQLRKANIELGQADDAADRLNVLRAPIPIGSA